jgi:hypothetical protein
LRLEGYVVCPLINLSLTTIISVLGWPGPIWQYQAANAHEHWIIEMMLTREEPFNGARLLLSTGM